MIYFQTEVFRVNGWILIENPEDGTGMVLHPEGEPTLAIAGRFGEPGDRWNSLDAALSWCQDGEPEAEEACTMCDRMTNTEDLDLHTGMCGDCHNL